LAQDFKTMRIVNNSNAGPGPADQTNRAAGTQPADAAAKGTAAAASSAAPDGLQLSRLADTLSQAIQSDAASRSQRVAQLAESVKSGSYQVDSAAVGHAIVDQAISAGQN
jgi:flagellar biosynthesis anti-sigma factor FlgM